MASFLQRAKEKAQEAAQQLSASASQHGAGASSSSASPGQSGNTGSSSGGAAGGLSSSTYTSSLPHMLRHGIASIDPRLQNNRSFYLFNNALKGVSIDNDALGRETHALARATYNYGQDHIASNRMDGIGDEVIVDV